ncbi:hypothetical protein SSX86_001818 [Deinandra increscens subsp. villosa]|uniref:Retrotransposon gag domain-containing protein n=1 Tax=Deinandra increscens subsp. villosa TaxID=3103831 RepID=A0AAP0H9L4_9ASTR
MPPLRRICRNSSSSKRRNINDAVQKAVENLLPNILQTVVQHVHAKKDNATPPPSSPPPSPRNNTPPSSLPRNKKVENTGSKRAKGIHTWNERFQKQKPRSFSNAATPVEASNWIAHIEKIFEILDIDDVFKTRLATYKLEDDARIWWEGIKLAQGGNGYAATLPWVDFRSIFFQQYFSEVERNEYAQEYASIEQRDNEPWSEFMARLCRLASFLGPAAGTQELQAEKKKWAVCEKNRRWIIT